MLLAVRFFSINDLFLVPLCVVILYAIIRSAAEKNLDPQIKRLYYRGFYFKVLCVFAYTILTEFYFKGGDTNLYYQGVLDLQSALSDDFGHVGDVVSTLKLNESNPLAPYFLYDNYVEDITYNYMRTAGNFFVPRLGLIPGVIFFNSYLCINLCFGFFALMGTLRTFKVFYHFYPLWVREIGIATIFIPSVGFWSSGLLKDPICFGCIGFVLYAVLNIFILKKNYVVSLAWIVVGGMLLYHIKVYILLVLILAVVIWLFAETNKLITDKTLRKIFSIMTLLIAGLITYFLLNYFTSQDVAQDYKIENLLEQTSKQRQVLDAVSTEGNSSFKINTSNPIVLVFSSIVATFFRPFIWEINTPIALLSAMESVCFLLLTLNFFFKRGVPSYFKTIFADPRMIMCFVFSIVFAIAVGASTSNFGALSRYKIPCMPFYFIMLMIVYRQAGLRYPKWFNKVLNWLK